MYAVIEHYQVKPHSIEANSRCVKHLETVEAARKFKQISDRLQLTLGTDEPFETEIIPFRFRCPNCGYQEGD